MKLLLIFVFFGFTINSKAQVNSFYFQDNCDFIYKHNSGLVYLSGIEGLYVFNGIEINKVELEGLLSFNVQSPFYFESDTTIWFSIYDRIILMNLKNHSYKEYFVKDETGKLYTSDYYIYAYEKNNSKLWVKIGSKLFSFDPNTKISVLWDENVEGYRILNRSIKDTTYLFSYYHTISPQIIKINEETKSLISREKWQNWPDSLITNDLLIIDESTALFATGKGLFVGNILSRSVKQLHLPYINDEFIMSMNWFDDGKIILSTFGKGHFILNLSKGLDSVHLDEFSLEGIPCISDRILRNADGTIFMSSYDYKIYYFNPDKIKIKNFSYEGQFNPLSDCELDLKLKYSNITERKKCIVGNNKYIEYTSCGLRTNTIVKFKNGDTEKLIHPGNSFLVDYYYDSKGNVYGSFVGGESGGKYSMLAVLKNGGFESILTPNVSNKGINFFYSLGPSYNIASVNGEYLVIWNSMDTTRLLKRISFSGSINNAIYLQNQKAIVLSTSMGIALLDTAQNKLSIIKDNSSCYCVLSDQENNIWYSTSSNIKKYNLSDRTIHAFTFLDGVSGKVYVPGECESTHNDSLYFTHLGGKSLVIPKAISLINTKSQVWVSEFKVNDVEYSNTELLNYNKNIRVKAFENTISFKLISIDYSDPKNANIRYKLIGLDTGWVYLPTNGSTVRYSKLAPGYYELNVQGSNSDSIWNSDIDRIKITVVPPIWKTWWFQVIFSLSIMLFLYLNIKQNFRRRLERRNQVVREQSLIIEKQQAIEKERTRIASEMHDDLGSGLTTIRYLSDRALRQAVDPEETDQIKRISEHSNTLVRNMAEIIWAMNSRFDTTENLVGYLRRYASEFLGEHNVALKFEAIQGEREHVSIGGEKRRNMFLVFKEILNNAVKYSGVSEVVIKITVVNRFAITIIENDGIGFDPTSINESGNGLHNCLKRMASIGGEMQYNRTTHGMVITFSTPLIS